MRDNLLGILAVAAAASIWGTLGLLAKMLYAEGVTFEALVAFRVTVGWLAVAGFLAVARGPRGFRVAGRDLIFLVSQGLVGIGAFYLLMHYTMRESGVGTTTILVYTAPAFVVVLARLFYREPLNAAKIFALALTIGGILMVVGVYDPSGLKVSSTILLTGLLAGLSYGLYAVFGRPVAGHLSPAVVLAHALFFAMIPLLIVSVPTLGTLTGLPAGYYAILLVLAVVHTAAAFALYTFGIGRLGAGRAAIVATFEVVVAGTLGVVVLAEDLTAPKVVGALLVVAGAMLAQVTPRKTRLSSSSAAAGHPR